MVRKTLTIFALAGVLALVVPAFIEAACCGDVSDCTGIDKDCVSHTDPRVSATVDCDDLDNPTWTKYCVNKPSDGGGATSGGDIGPKDYFKIRRGFKLDLKNPDGTGAPQPTTFEKGAVVYSEKTAGIANCYGKTTVADGDRCYASEAGIIALLNIIYSITDWIFYLLTLFVVIMIIFGGFSIITASGDPEKAAKGRGILTYAIIGLAVALLAKLIPSLVSFIMGM